MLTPFFFTLFSPRMPLHKSSSEDGSGGKLRCVSIYVFCCLNMFPTTLSFTFIDPWGEIER